MIFRSSRYTEAVDIWAVGCLVGEMFLGGPLFPGIDFLTTVGHSTLDQVSRIFAALGKPRQEELEEMKSKIPYSQIEPMQVIKSKTLTMAIKHLPNDAQDFIKLKFRCNIRKCLQYSPSKRPSAQNLLEHKFLNFSKEKYSPT